MSGEEKQTLQVGSRISLKKKHPCGSFEWEVLRVGSDIKIRCLGCGRTLMLPRHSVQASMKKNTGKTDGTQRGDE